VTSGRPCHHTWQAGRTTATAIGLGAKFTIALIPVLLTVLACLLAGGALTAILSPPLHGTIYADRVNYGELALDTLRTAYIILLYVALSFMLAVLTRSTAVTGSLIFLLVIETVLNVALPILGKPSAQIAQYIPTNLIKIDPETVGKTAEPSRLMRRFPILPTVVITSTVLSVIYCECSPPLPHCRHERG
jgi:hypothetical protein